MQDVSGTGLSLRVIASKTYPVGILCTAFADDTDPLDFPEQTITEFGMGLKTAASWFGNLWCVESTQLGSTNKYYTEVDIDELRSKNLNNIDIIAVDCGEIEHGTTITIKNITKKGMVGHEWYLN